MKSLLVLLIATLALTSCGNNTVATEEVVAVDSSVVDSTLVVDSLALDTTTVAGDTTVN